MATLIRGRRIVKESPLLHESQVVRLEPTDDPAAVAVSYTHLTLPTILLV